MNIIRTVFNFIIKKLNNSVSLLYNIYIYINISMNNNFYNIFLFNSKIFFNRILKIIIYINNNKFNNNEY